MDDERYMPQNDLQIFHQKEMIRTNATIAKEYQISDIKEAYAQKREVRHEFQREARKSQYDEIRVIGTGELILETKNSWICVPERKVVNFKFKGLFPLVSSDGDKGIFALDLEIADVDFYVYLDESKIAKNNYLLRKITAVGGQVFANSQKGREEILRNFWTTVYPLRTDDVIIPTHTGWISDGNDSFIFVKEGETLWRDIIKKTK